MNSEQHSVPNESGQTLPVSEEPTGSPGQYPKTGLAISIQGESKETLAATVVEGSPDKTWLELARPPSPLPFRKGEQVRIKYWDEGSIAYYWDAKVAKIIGSQRMALRMRSEGVTVQRRRSVRVRVQIPLFFTVIDAADAQLIGENFNCKSQNISVGGLAFETNLLLKVGDKLAMKVQFNRLSPIDVVGWILRSEPVDRKGECLNSVAFEFLQFEAQDQNQLLQFLAYAEANEKGS